MLVTTFAGGAYPGGNCSFSASHTSTFYAHRLVVKVNKSRRLGLTEEELNGSLGGDASLHVPKDHDEGDGLARGEGLSEPREAELGVGRVGGADAGGPALGGRVDVDGVLCPLRQCLVEDGLVEGVRVAKEGVLAAAGT